MLQTSVSINTEKRSWQDCKNSWSNEFTLYRCILAISHRLRFSNNSTEWPTRVTGLAAKLDHNVDNSRNKETRPISQYHSHSARMNELRDPSTTSCSALPDPKPMPPHRLPLTSLSSVPCSGNTWMRILLSSLTGKVKYNSLLVLMTFPLPSALFNCRHYMTEYVVILQC